MDIRANRDKLEQLYYWTIDLRIVTEICGNELKHND